MKEYASYSVGFLQDFNMVFNPERGYYGIMAELADARDLKSLGQ